jgi:hypothetical protein
MGLYRNSIFQGGWFSFNSTKENWNKISKEMYDYFFGSVMFDEVFGVSKTSEELFIKTDQNFDFIKDKSVLVVGGGPSSKSLTSEIIESYDLVFSCNHFFKNELLKKHKVSLALIGDEINFSDKEFIEYLNQYNTILGFEHSSKRSTINLISLKENYPFCFIYLTRYFSRLGYAPRACILAKLFGAKKVDFIGIDGFKDKNTFHYFEKDKEPPPFNNNEKFKEQMRIFCEYMLKDLKIEPQNFNDLSSNNLYEGILEDVKSKL